MPKEGEKIFLSTPSGWRATIFVLTRSKNGSHFYPRPPGGGRQQKREISFGADVISIHALRVEGDISVSLIIFRPFNFYPRPPGGGRPEVLPKGAGRHGISIHALRVEGDYKKMTGDAPRLISIHALRVEGDPARKHAGAGRKNFYPRPPGGGRLGRRNAKCLQRTYFYPRPPGGGRQWHLKQSCCVAALFLSTPSGWRATVVFEDHKVVKADFYPRPPGGGRPSRCCPSPAFSTDFYPRPPGGGRRDLPARGSACAYNFYPRPPGGGRPAAKGRKRRCKKKISIHALRVEGDRAFHTVTRRSD